MCGEVVNVLLDDELLPVLNKNWPAFVKEQNLDPWLNPYQGNVNLHCKNGGDEICGVLELGSCEDFSADVTVEHITGLSQMRFADLVLTELAAATGTTGCP